LELDVLQNSVIFPWIGNPIFLSVLDNKIFQNF